MLRFVNRVHCSGTTNLFQRVVRSSNATRCLSETVTSKPDVDSAEEEAARKKKIDRADRLAALSSWAGSDPERKALIDEVLRVDHAGEYGAVRIYNGQKMVLQKTSPEEVPVIQHMQRQEEEHLAGMERLVSERRVRPTALLPVWHVAGLMLGASTALLGKRAAHACTVAVEEVIGEHYNDQIRELLARGYDEEELLQILRKNRDEEMEHLDTAKERGAEQTPGYDILRQIIKTGCHTAIAITKRI